MAAFNFSSSTGYPDKYVERGDENRSETCEKVQYLNKSDKGYVFA